MGVINELPEQALKKIKKSLYSCKTPDQVTTVINWVGGLKLTKDLATNRQLFNVIEETGKTLTQYLEYQKSHIND